MSPALASLIYRTHRRELLEEKRLEFSAVNQATQGTRESMQTFLGDLEEEIENLQKPYGS